MRLLVDEDSQAKSLIRQLVAAGHDVLTADVAGLNSMADEEVLSRASLEGRVLLTRNCGDFLALHAAGMGHAGILAVYQEGEITKNMTYAEIVRAIGNVQGSGMDVSGQFVALNAWRG